MASFDGAATGTGYPPSGISCSHPIGVPSGNDRLVVAFLFMIGGSSHNLSSFSYNGQSMNFLAAKGDYYFSRLANLHCYYILDSSLPSSPGSYTCRAVFNGPYEGVLHVVSYKGVYQGAPPHTSAGGYVESPPFGEGTNHQSSITVAASGGLVVDGFGIEEIDGPGTISPGGGQTERREQWFGSSDVVVSEKPFTS